MRTSPHLQRKPAGGVIILALIVIGFVTVGFTTWITLLGQRGRAAEVEEFATRRRIAAYNSRAAIHEYVLQRMITSSVDADGVSFDPLGTSAETGGAPDYRPLKGMTVTSAAAWSGYSMDSTTRLAGLNGFSPTWDYPYSKLLDVTAATKALGFTRNGSGPLDRTLTSTASYLKTYVRSRNLPLGGDLLVVHRSRLAVPADPAVTGNVTVNGRVMHFRPDLATASYTAKSARFVSSPGTTNVRPKSLTGTNLLPSNLSWVPITWGTVSGSTDYSGKLNVIDDSTNGGNSLVSELTASAATLQNTGSSALSDPRGYSNPATGIVSVTPCIGSTNPADLPSVIIRNEVQELIIEGQDPTNFSNYARYRPAMAVVYEQDTTSVKKLATIRLRKQGGRRMVLAIKQNGTVAGSAVNIVVEDTNTTSEWNVIIIAENTPLTFTSSGGATTISVVGGIETDAALTGPGTGKSLALSLQADTRGLIKLAPRAAWVESLMPDKVPGTSNDNTW